MATTQASSKTKPAYDPYVLAKKAAKARKKKPTNELTRDDFTEGELVIMFIEKYLKIPEGKDVGKPVVLRDWQKRIIHSIYDDTYTSQAIVSFPRKNGKTSLIAMLMAAHLMGPVSEKNSQIYSAAQSRDQAAIVFNLLAKMIRLSRYLSNECRILDSTKTIHAKKTGVMYKALAADAARTYGLSPVFVVHDELGQVRGPRSQLYDALETAMGAHERALSIIISTQAATDQDLLSILIDDAERSDDPAIKLHLYAAPKESDPWDEQVWHDCNPALGDFLNVENFKQQAKMAERLPVQEASFRNLRLNQRVTVSNVLLTNSVWQLSSAQPDFEVFERGRVLLGVDLSKTTDLTAVVAVCMDDETGVYHVIPHFWTPESTLKARAERDRTPYDLWVEQGYMETTPGSSVDYSFVAQQCAEMYGDCDVEALMFDRWRIDEFKRELDKIGWAPPMVPHGQGYRDMAPAVSRLEELALDGMMAHGNHPVMTHCIANAVVTMDPAGNRKLDKERATGRMDGAVALAMALNPKRTTEVVDIEAMIG